MDNEEEFNKYLEYIISISDRSDMIGTSSHTVDIVKKQLKEVI